jgi:glycosyltransferase involved in cell wall biosynthesis
MNVSIIICCYNSATRLYPTLEHLAKQRLNGLSCELLIIDNNCSDDTVDVAQKAWSESESPFPLIILEEKNPGLSNARKAGVMEAQGEIIIFCDDDNWLDQNYLKLAFDLFQKDVKIFGACGFCEPVAEITLPDWFDRYAHFYACGVPHLENNHLAVLRGAGMVVRTSVLKALYIAGISHFTSGRNGANLTSGEDNEISFWFRIMGGQIVYNESLQLNHFMEERRLKADYRDNLMNGTIKSLNELNYFIKILKQALKIKRKMDYLLILQPGYKGVSARLKLGFFYFIDKRIIKNYQILKKSKYIN